MIDRSNRISGHYDWDRKIPRRAYDVLKAYDETYHLLEVNDDGDLVCAFCDENGDYDYMRVRTFEDFEVDFVCRWEDARFVAAGAGI